MSIVNVSGRMSLLKPVSFAELDFPRWQSVLAVTLIALLMGLDPSMTSPPPYGPGMPVWAAVAVSLLMMWVCFLVSVWVLRWWMKRGGRWDGQGDLFNLLAAAWLLVDVLGSLLVAAGVPMIYTAPIWLYSIWVTGEALTGVVPQATLGYAIAGILLCLLAVALLSNVVFVGAAIVLANMGAFAPA